MKTVLGIVITASRQHLVPSPTRREKVDADVSTSSVLEADSKSHVLQLVDFLVSSVTCDSVDSDRQRSASGDFPARNYMINSIFNIELVSSTRQIVVVKLVLFSYAFRPIVADLQMRVIGLYLYIV